MGKIRIRNEYDNGELCDFLGLILACFINDVDGAGVAAKTAADIHV